MFQFASDCTKPCMCLLTKPPLHPTCLQQHDSGSVRDEGEQVDRGTGALQLVVTGSALVHALLEEVLCSHLPRHS
jgi:hypothetical protein